MGILNVANNSSPAFVNWSGLFSLACARTENSSVTTVSCQSSLCYRAFKRTAA